MQKTCRNHAEKLVRDLFLALVNKQNRHSLHEIALKIRYFKVDYQKALKKLSPEKFLD